jgi:gephyrin
MARPVAGVRGQSLVVSVPGSPKGAKENVLAMMELLPHACDLAYGGDSRSMHRERGVAEKGTEVMGEKERVGHLHVHVVGVVGEKEQVGHHHHHVHGVKPRTTEEQRKLLSNELGGKGIPFSKGS